MQGNNKHTSSIRIVCMLCICCVCCSVDGSLVSTPKNVLTLQLINLTVSLLLFL